jgi:PAS domain S-box-containing protein
MPAHGPERGIHAPLRGAAEARLGDGTAPRTNTWPIGLDALALLYRLASDPASAGDALKLLHELQVHQVELDLQHAQFETNERELTYNLARYKALYDFAPVGYFIVGLDGQIMEGNDAGARLLGVEQDALSGQPMYRFLVQDSQPLLAQLLEQLRDGQERAACDVQSSSGRATAGLLRIDARVSPGGEAVLMVASGRD